MKYLLVLLVVLVAAWMLLRRRDPPKGAPRQGRPAGSKAEPPAQTQPMLACAHCGLHLPQAEAQMDAAGRPFCSEAHRLAGPR